MKSLFLVVLITLTLRAADSRLIDREAVKGLFDDNDRSVLEADTSFDDKEGKRAEGEGNGPPEGEGNGPPEGEGRPEGKGEAKCHCEDKCPALEVPAHLVNESNFFKHETYPIDCRKGSRVYDAKNDNYLCEDLYDCCRSCNAEFFKCLKKRGGPNKLGVNEQCLREAYKCMCKCLENNPLPRINEIP